ncbi:GNAT family N-acetyltransferase [Streptomyces sp. SB3404]|uniref:GNAT family N-acetyltransferase n=1 Tax=Streptomyces boncukensis TaxID=2711219 RepID=A0A6G4WV81_9ACTN|nr:GNAT family N-acetyltransferase [Streptomyces boncukensis]
MELRRVTEENLEALLAVAVDDAEPEEVMPPVPGPPGWTGERRDAFRAWHRARLPGLEGPLGEAAYAVVDGGRVAGSARLARPGGRPGTLETGLWLGRSHRGRGIGTAVLGLLLDEATAAGAHRVIADTTAGNAAAIGALRRGGARLTAAGDTAGDTAAGGTADVYAELRLPGGVTPPRPGGGPAPGSSSRTPRGASPR